MKTIKLLGAAAVIAASSTLQAASLLVDATVNNHSTVNEYETITVSNGGTLNLTGGAVTVPKQSAQNNVEKIWLNGGSLLDISGGTHIFNERIAGYGAAVNTFRITGSEATINVHQQSYFNVKMEFIFDANGISTFDSDSRLGFGGNDLLVDTRNYTGESMTFVLIDVEDTANSSGFGGDIEILTAAGYTAVYDQSQMNTGAGEITVTLTAVPEPSSTALLGLGGLSLMLRRRR